MTPFRHGSKREKEARRKGTHFFWEVLELKIYLSLTVVFLLGAGSVPAQQMAPIPDASFTTQVRKGKGSIEVAFQISGGKQSSKFVTSDKDCKSVLNFSWEAASFHCTKPSGAVVLLFKKEKIWQGSKTEGVSNSQILTEKELLAYAPLLRQAARTQNELLFYVIGTPKESLVRDIFLPTTLQDSVRNLAVEMQEVVAKLRIGK